MSLKIFSVLHLYCFVIQHVMFCHTFPQFILVLVKVADKKPINTAVRVATWTFVSDATKTS